jgi:hypothetical protein
MATTITTARPNPLDVRTLSIKQRIELMRACADSLIGVVSKEIEGLEYLYIFDRLKCRNEQRGHE